eukprot:792689-Amorphochlora_amoeboformis.AAC.1
MKENRWDLKMVEGFISFDPLGVESRVVPLTPNASVRARIISELKAVDLSKRSFLLIPREIQRGRNAEMTSEGL